MRDDFPEKTKELLAKRVGYRCSLCYKPTCGPGAAPNGVINLGVAAHISAASPGGPRYDDTITKGERKSIENGIWLCQNCAHYIDSDVEHFTIRALIEIKQIAEKTAFLNISAYDSNEKAETFGLKINREKKLPLESDFQQIKELNNEYKECFRAINGCFIDRKEYKQCIELLQQEKSLVITGRAGMGKSGCTEAIIQYCETIKIPYLAIKLDHRPPFGSCSKWGESMGFSGSFIHILDHISNNGNAMIIIDQLDALRWTKSNSAEALDVCFELIGYVNELNKERSHKISIVFVCRKYDLENDRSIINLFEVQNKEYHINWEKIDIGEWDEETVKKIVGDAYSSMSEKLKELLRIPNNLYIWVKLDNKEQISGYFTSWQLMHEWSSQIIRMYPRKGYSDDVKKAIAVLADRIEKTGRLFVPKESIQISLTVYEYLVSSGIVIENKKKIGFVHQSVSDYYISDNMINQYYSDIPIYEIIGTKEKQTPTRRYQTQLFLQRILETDEYDFIKIADLMLQSKEIRHYVKHLIYECIGQIDNPDMSISDYVISRLEHADEIEHWLNSVIYGKQHYVQLLLMKGILGKWFQNPRKKNYVYSIIRSVSKNLSKEVIDFIEERSFINPEDDKLFEEVLWREIYDENDAMFEYRLKLYENYPQFIHNSFIQLGELLPKHEKRAYRIVDFYFRHKKELTSTRINGITNILDAGENLCVNDGNSAIELLLKYVPRKKYTELRFTDWNNRLYANASIERLIMDLLKAANKAVILNNPTRFWDYYAEYLGKGYCLYDELVLYGMMDLPGEYSDRILKYISSNFDNNIYDDSSGADDPLACTKIIVRKHAQSCTIEALRQFEEKLIHYYPTHAINDYKERIRYKKEDGISTYKAFYGKLQHVLLGEIPQERLSKQSRELLSILERKFGNKKAKSSRVKADIYMVKSPIEGRRIGYNHWAGIITNAKLLDPSYRKMEWQDQGTVEHSLEMFVSEFRNEVYNNPKNMVELLLANKSTVIPAFVDALFSGLAYTENKSSINNETIEQLFCEYPNKIRESCAGYFCDIIIDRDDKKWSQNVIDTLIWIVKNHQERLFDAKQEDEISASHLRDYSYNCVKGKASRAIAVLLDDKRELFGKFKESIALLSKDKDILVKFSSLHPLSISMDIDREWVIGIMLSIYKDDTRFLIFNGSQILLYELYNEKEEEVRNILINGFNSSDKDVIKPASYCICEIYFNVGAFSDIINSINELNNDQIIWFTEMAICYMEFKKYKEQAKSLIITILDSKANIDNALAKAFNEYKIDLDKDHEFVEKIVLNRRSKTIIHSFVKGLERSGYSCKMYANTIFDLYAQASKEKVDINYIYWGIAKEISLLIFKLYDECVGSDLDRQIVYKCMDIWDDMYEKQYGYTRELSRQLMER